MNGIAQLPLHKSTTGTELAEENIVSGLYHDGT